MKSTFGHKIRTTVYGGSHEPFVGVSVKGLPADFTPDTEKLQAFLDRRAPGRSELTSSRREDDVPSLVKDETRLGFRTLEFLIPNRDARPEVYEKFRTVPRPGHADYTARLRYGDSLNMSGGGPFSGRMTAPLCVAGGLALQVLEEMGISITARLVSESFLSDLRHALESGDSLGGVVECTATGVPSGIGGAMYDGIEGLLSEILFGIPAVKGVEFGAGFRLADMKGSEANDAFYCEDKAFPKGNLPVLKTRTNNCGGILGGITTGMPVVCRVAFKPTPSIGLPQESVNLETGESETLIIQGRHDPCVAVRAVPVVEAAVALGLLDAIRITEADRKSSESKASDYAESLDNLRGEINEIDNEILSLIKQRTDISTRIAKAKKEAGLPVRDAAREAEILDRISGEAGADLKPFAEQIYKWLFAASRRNQERILGKSQKDSPADAEPVFGLVGTPLGHSFSKEVHQALGEYEFQLFDVSEEELAKMLTEGNFNGLTVTRPYKETVISFCDKLTPRAKSIGAVNTLYWETDPETGNRLLVGHNTDYDGFLYTAQRSGIDFSGKTVLILGSGGTSKTVKNVLTNEGAKAVYQASRQDGSYEKLPEIASKIEIIINTTPVGTYPNNLEQIVKVSDFPYCQAVIDVVYNPEKTALILEAESLGLKTAGGMPMIVAQAMVAAERFLDKPLAFTGKTEDVLARIQSEKSNVVLIGMPGCGKTTIGKKIASLTGRKFVDFDEEIMAETGRNIDELFATDGEDFFRKIESEMAARFGREHGLVIATGGGCVTTPENYRALKQNGQIIWLTRPLENLPLAGRPLSTDYEALKKMETERSELYRKWADFQVDSDSLKNILGGLFE